MNVCPKCHTPTLQGAARCVRCGLTFTMPRPQTAREIATREIQVTPDSHSVGTAILASIVATGFGQLYNKQMGKGILILSLGVALVVGSIDKAFSDWLAAAVFFSVGALLLILLATLDAALIATKLKRGETVRKWQWF